MDNSSYEETRLKRDESWAKWIKEGDEVPLVSWKGVVISVEYPKTATLKIVSTDPGLQGNRSNAGTKPATLETGAQIQVGDLLFLALPYKFLVGCSQASESSLFWMSQR